MTALIYGILGTQFDFQIPSCALDGNRALIKSNKILDIHDVD